MKIRFFCFFIALFLVTACSKRVVVDPSHTSPHETLIQSQSISDFKFYFQPEVNRKIMDDDLELSPKEFKKTLIRYLNKFSLFDSTQKTGVVASINIEQLRVRSYVSAAVLGSKAGPDFMSGQVKILDSESKIITEFEVSVSYLHANIFSTQDKRLAWLIRAFSQQIALKLSGNS